jgi:hypothetical protein
MRSARYSLTGLLHGFPQTHRMWRHVAARLAVDQENPERVTTVLRGLLARRGKVSA